MRLNGVTQPLDINVTDLDHLHDSPVHALTWRVAPPKGLVPGRARPNRCGRAVRASARAVGAGGLCGLVLRPLSAVGHVAHGEEFDSDGTELDAADIRQLAQSAADGYRVPPVRFRFALTSGTEGVVVCKRIEVEAMAGPSDGF